MPKVTAERQVLYPVVSFSVCQGDLALTDQKAKDILGWTIVEDSKTDYLLKDINGDKICCVHNIGNRPFSHSRMLYYARQILKRNWQFNGHTRIIGRTGVTLSGQHVLPALIIANQLWEKDKTKWPLWKTPPTIETFICFGIEETEEIKNTIDTARESTLGDVFYRTHHFESRPTSSRKELATIMQWAVKCLLHRTGYQNAFEVGSKSLSHQESVDFVDEHPKLVTAVVAAQELDNLKGKFMTKGVAAAMYYLMASSSSSFQEYHVQDTPSEECLDWSREDKANAFLVGLNNGEAWSKPIATAIAKLIDNEEDKLTVKKLAIVCKAWRVFINGGKITAAKLRLDETLDIPVGGIDAGNPANKKQLMEIEPPASAPKRPSKARKAAGPKKPSRKGSEWLEGDVAWISDDDEPFLAILQEDPQLTAAGHKVMVLTSSGDDWEVDLSQLSLERPDS